LFSRFEEVVIIQLQSVQIGASSPHFFKVRIFGFPNDLHV
jgi:hypothetical protein